MELTLHELTLVDHSVLQLQLAVAMPPSLLLLSLIRLSQPVGHEVIYIISLITLMRRTAIFSGKIYILQLIFKKV
jgi:hypothetical protein